MPKLRLAKNADGPDLDAESRDRRLLETEPDPRDDGLTGGEGLDEEALEWFDSDDSFLSGEAFDRVTEDSDSGDYAEVPFDDVDYRKG